jgi:hypothetical protein
MHYSKSLMLAAVLFIAIAVPVGVFADTPAWCNSSFGTWWGVNCSTVTAGQGGVLVYVQVIQNSYGATPSPSDFIVSISGQQPTQTSFAGSINGVPVYLNPGSYNVFVSNQSVGYKPQYSVGCSGDIKSGEHKLCVVTMASDYSFYSHTTVYPYPYNYQPLVCSPANQTVSIGGVGHFVASGGIGGSYIWRTSERSYYNSGSVLNATFSIVGMQTVTVNSGSQSADCYVNVVAQQGYSYSAPIKPETYIAGVYPNVVYTSSPYASYGTSYPKLPNTGVEPVDAVTTSAFASVLLIAAGIALYPYGRKTLATFSS